MIADIIVRFGLRDNLLYNIIAIVLQIFHII